MDLNFPVFATGVRIFRASNDIGPLFLDPGSTRILEINTRYATKWRGTAKFLFIVDFPDFWKINGWNALTLWTPISCCAPGLLSYSYYFAYNDIYPRQTDCQLSQRSILDSLQLQRVFRRTNLAYQMHLFGGLFQT
jgi:hypothetical protein